MVFACADTSFLLSLYIDDGNTTRAVALISTFRRRLPLTPLHRLELRNALAQQVYRHRRSEKTSALDDTTAAQVWMNIETDSQGVLSGGQPLEWLVVLDKAEQLVIHLTPQTGARSLDVLQVAAALSLGTKTFISFDQRQCELAKMAGLVVVGG